MRTIVGSRIGRVGRSRITLPVHRTIEIADDVLQPAAG